MILAIDAGNSRVRAAFFDDDPVEPLAVAGCSGGAMFDYAQWLALLPALEAQVAARSKSPVSAAGLCSVVPGVNRLLVESVEERYQVQPVVAGAHTAKNISIEYEPAQSLGADRVANAIAAEHLWPGSKTLIVDAGTAITFCLVDGGRHRGGLILPGLGLAAKALGRETALLPEVELRVDVPLLGTSTADGIVSGLVNGWAGMLRGLVARFESEYGPLDRVVLCGGSGPLFSVLAAPEAMLCPHLTLLGAALCAKLNAPQR